MKKNASSDDTMARVLDIEKLEANVDELHARYMAADPYPHIVFDDFLRPEAVAAAVEEFPPLDPSQWNNYLHTNERKFSNTDPETWGPTLQAILDVLNSPSSSRSSGSSSGSRAWWRTRRSKVGDSISRRPMDSSTSTRTSPCTPTIASSSGGQHPPLPEPGLEARLRRRPGDLESGHEGVRREVSRSPTGPDLLHRAGLLPRSPDR